MVARPRHRGVTEDLFEVGQPGQVGPWQVGLWWVGLLRPFCCTSVRATPRGQELFDNCHIFFSASMQYIRTKSFAAAGLSAWVINICKYFRIYQVGRAPDLVQAWVTRPRDQGLNSARNHAPCLACPPRPAGGGPQARGAGRGQQEAGGREQEAERDQGTCQGAAGQGGLSGGEPDEGHRRQEFCHRTGGQQQPRRRHRRHSSSSSSSSSSNHLVQLCDCCRRRSAWEPSGR